MASKDLEGLTIFSMPKPFRGLVGIIQRNAIRSWLKLDPSCEIILLGDDEGVAEAATELGVMHVPNVAKNEFGTPLVNSVFDMAESLSSHRLMAHVNADIILMSDFIRAACRIPWPAFEMVGQRWNLTVREPLDFEFADWENKLRSATIASGYHTGSGCSDYFVFPRGVLGEIPPFAIGRMAYDTWLLYRARALGIPLVDASSAVVVVHQNHDYAHFPEVNGMREGTRGDPKQAESYQIAGMKEWLQTFESPEVKRNQQLAGGNNFSLLAATWLLTPNGLRRAITREHLRYRIGTLPILHPWLRPVFRFVKHLVRRS